MEKYRIKFEVDKTKLKEGTKYCEIIPKDMLDNEIPVVLVKSNYKYNELSSIVENSGEVHLVDIRDRLGMRAYIRTLQFVLIKAVLDLYPQSKICMEHALSKGIFGEIHKESSLTESDIVKIKNRMKEIINKNIEIKKHKVQRLDAIEIFKNYEMEDKIKLLETVKSENVKLYEMDGLYDYFYGSMAYSTGVLKYFDLVLHGVGFLLRYPTESEPTVIPKLEAHRKLEKIFYETEKWGHILGVADVGSLNKKVENNEIINIIRVAEALHEKKIAYIADMIHEKNHVKLVLIAGPSSSGKTTFARRLGVQLRVNGLVPVPISLDDYFVDRDATPKDENGEYDFESIFALDLNLFNEHLEAILNGEEIELPSFNFKTGKREWNGEKIKLPENGILIVEGIHGLNETLTSAIPMENKFKIYISALTQLNLDDHNRIATTDVRIVRRIVRDYLSRGYSAEATLKMWPSIKRGEEKNIFVYQENADVMFNSSMVYELCVLKKYAIAELDKVLEDSPIYYEALRLASFLRFFYDVDMSYVPDNSILREFIGGSCFYKY